MSWQGWVRRVHRWDCVVFTLFVLANFAVMPLGNEQLGQVVGGLTLVPLVVLLVTGLVLFVQPWVGARRAAAPESDG